jgi:hypothetical protein
VKGKKGQRQFTYCLFSLITGIETKMLLIIILGLIAKLTSVCKGCDVGTSEVNNLDVNKIGIGVLIRLLKQTAFVIAAGINISFEVPLTNSQYTTSKSVRLSDTMIYIYLFVNDFKRLSLSN